jgi:hypothetical protein
MTMLMMCKDVLLRRQGIARLNCCQSLKKYNNAKAYGKHSKHNQVQVLQIHVNVQTVSHSLRESAVGSMK